MAQSPASPPGDAAPTMMVAGGLFLRVRCAPKNVASRL